MNLRQLLTAHEIQLPIQRDTEDFHGFMQSKLSRYLELLDDFTAPTDIKDAIAARRSDIETLCRTLPQVIKATFAGHPQEAYELFVSGITPLNDIVQKQALSGQQTRDLGLLYRVRRQLNGPVDKEGLFHIPFEKRHLVSTQRYSIPGLPCLYLGGSLYTCWAEMGKPPFHELYASAFWVDPDEKISILNFSRRPCRLLLTVDPEGGLPDDKPIRDDISTHLILWPLMAACSIVVKHRDAPYKPEYIIPQTVLQWITKEHAYDGICYFSTHVNAVTPTKPLVPCNLVFPARNIIPEGRCHHLRMKFRLTSPENWQVLSSINVNNQPFSIPDFEFEFISGQKEQYYRTGFGHVQWKLDKMASLAMQKHRDGEGQVLP